MTDGSPAEEKSAGSPSPAKPKSRLVRKYGLLISFLVAGVLVVSGVVEIYFSYQ